MTQFARCGLKHNPTIGTMAFIDDDSLINESGTKTIRCQIMALKFVNKNLL